MNETLEVLFGLLGGLALFIFGMNQMSESLQKVAGERMKNVLALLTKNPILGVLAGALTTAVLQSSSATTVMAIGFVSARLMSTRQAIAIILGANIGTTITAQIIAFKLSDYILIIIFVGFVIMYFGRREKTKYLGRTIFAFGVLFLGIDTMGGAMKPLASSPVFTQLISEVTDIPILGVLLGTFMTLLVQSSSATNSVLQNFASTPDADGVTSIIGLTGAIPILLGDNIGTTITALFAAVGQSRNAKRVALSHCIFNISGAVLFIWFIVPFAQLITWISPSGPEVEVIARQIANAHTCFNIIMTLIWLPLIGVLAKLVTWILPDRPRKHPATALYNIETLANPLYLDHRFSQVPASALQLTVQESVRCGEILRININDTLDAMRDKDKDQLEELKNRMQAISALCKRMNDFVAEIIASGALTEDQVTHITGVVRVINEQQRIAAHSMNVINGFEVESDKYTAEAVEGLCEAFAEVELMYETALTALKTNDHELAGQVIRMQATMLDIDMRQRRENIRRTAEKTDSADVGGAFVIMLNDIDLIANSCVAIAETIEARKVDFTSLATQEEIHAASETMPALEA
ncbi:MAG: Na/Pi cotransporter family protein [Eggerthellaceae bacterium]|nr:Na/Pi cotransporter family protein [Eggerthellaceae bacterium]